MNPDRLGTMFRMNFEKKKDAKKSPPPKKTKKSWCCILLLPRPFGSNSPVVSAPVSCLFPFFHSEIILSNQ